MSGRGLVTTLIVRSIKFPPHGPGSQCPVFIKNVVHTKLCKFLSRLGRSAPDWPTPGDDAGGWRGQGSLGPAPELRVYLESAQKSVLPRAVNLALAVARVLVSTCSVSYWASTVSSLLSGRGSPRRPGDSRRPRWPLTTLRLLSRRPENARNIRRHLNVLTTKCSPRNVLIFWEICFVVLWQW